MSEAVQSGLKALTHRKLTIGAKSINIRFSLAPMAFLSHVALRDIVRGHGGCGLFFSEMSSAKAVLQENRHVSPYFKWDDGEAANLVFQLLGNNPEAMAGAARRLENFGFFGVDLNFSCAAGVIRKTGGGAALLKDPALALNIVKAVRKTISIPLFVKFRLNSAGDLAFAVNFAKALESEGVDALTFHPRLATDRRNRRPNWDAIGKVKQAVNVPVFGNGDIFTAATAFNVMRQTGCDGLSLGRMALTRPWIFAEMTGDYIASTDAYRLAALEMARKLEEYFAPEHRLRRYQRFMSYFSANFVYGHSFYPKIKSAPDMAAAVTETLRFFDTNPAVSDMPNINFMI